MDRVLMRLLEILCSVSLVAQLAMMYAAASSTAHCQQSLSMLSTSVHCQHAYCMGTTLSTYCSTTTTWVAHRRYIPLL